MKKLPMVFLTAPSLHAVSYASTSVSTPAAPKYFNGFYIGAFAGGVRI